MILAYSKKTQQMFCNFLELVALSLHIFNSMCGMFNKAFNTCNTLSTNDFLTIQIYYPKFKSLVLHLKCTINLNGSVFLR